MIQINGSETQYIAGETVAQMFVRAGYDPDRRGFAIAINGEVVPRSTWPAVQLNDRDIVEVICAVQGG